MAVIPGSRRNNEKDARNRDSNRVRYSRNDVHSLIISIYSGPDPRYLFQNARRLKKKKRKERRNAAKYRTKKCNFPILNLKLFEERIFDDR